MLLYSRLKSLKAKEVPGGTLELKDDYWRIKYPNGRIETLFCASNLKGYATSISKYQDDKMTELEALVHRLFPATRSIAQPIREAKLTPAQFSEMIGIHAAQGRYVVDCLYSSHFPMFSAFEQSSTAADEFCQKFAGCYYLYRYDFNQAVDDEKYPNGLLIRATLSIRYPVPYKAYTTESDATKSVRAKLNLPSYHDTDFELYEYDGIVGMKAGRKISSKKKQWWTWLFQGRFGDDNSHIEDLALVYTEAMTHHDQQWAHGSMLTQNQDNDNTPTQSNIVIYRDPAYRLTERQDTQGSVYLCLDPDENEFMSRRTACLDPGDKTQLNPIDQEAIARLMYSARKGTPFR